MSKKEQKLEFEHATIYQTNENCQVFTAPITGAIFAMPGAVVNQYTQGQTAANESQEKDAKVEETTEVAAGALKPHFFKTRLFASDAALQRVRTLIANSMDLGEYNAEFGERNEYCINPMAQNEWFYLMKAIQEAGIAGTFTVPKFIEIMLDWFPCLREIMKVEEGDKFERKMERSISNERGLWKYGTSKEDTAFKDMWARRQQLGIDSAKLQHVYDAAYKGLCERLTDFRKELGK